MKPSCICRLFADYHQSFFAYLSVLFHYSKRIEDQYLQIKCRTSGWVEEGDTNSQTALGGTCALWLFIGHQKSTHLCVAQGTIYAYWNNSHTDDCLKNKPPTKTQKEEQAKKQYAPRRGHHGGKYGCNHLSTALLNFPICFQDYFVEWIFADFHPWVNVYSIQNTPLSFT